MGVCSAESLDIYENNVYELDVSDLTIDEIVLTLVDVIDGKEKLSFGEIDFMDWLLYINRFIFYFFYIVIYLVNFALFLIMFLAYVT